ncbi:MAG TPA: site-specific integrase, partial [Gammaproteobacteria bacterium]|nr:site-specific integrase [Gammaproteobacteria bacterium]
MATIRKRPGPRGATVWQAQIIRLGFKRQYRTFDSKGDAESWARRVEAEMDADLWQDRSEGDRTTVAQALGRYLAEVTPHKAATTAANERTRILRLQKGPLSHVSLSRVTGRDVADFIRARQRDGVKPATIVSELASLSHLYTV